MAAGGRRNGRSRRSGKKGLPDWFLGTALAVAGLAILLAVGLAAWWLRASRVELDEATNCPVSGPAAIHVIIIDRSDPMTGQQVQRVRQTIESEKVNAPPGYRFDIYTVEGDGQDVHLPVLSICSLPTDGSIWTENPERVRQRYEQRFASVLDAALDDLVQRSERPSSPIMETIRGAALTSFGAAAPNQISLRMTLVSDMIQHTDAFSQYRESLSFEEFSRLAVWPALRPDLKGAAVEILYVARDGARRGGAPIQSRGHQAFWEDYIRAGFGVPRGMDLI